MKSASHSERERFVAAVVRVCPNVSDSSLQRLFRLAYAHATLGKEQNSARKLFCVERKIVEIAHGLKLSAVFNHENSHSVKLVLPNGARLNVPTSTKGTL